MANHDQQVLRTPDQRFLQLPDFPFKPHYNEELPGFAGLRVHYVDEGPRDAPVTALCLHGQPTWSYLYRKMIPVFVAAGIRVVAPDLLGFGRSDKPVDEAFYTFERHRNLLLAFIRYMKLDNVMLVVQDWGGLLGLTLPMDLPGRVTRLLVMNTTLATADVPLSSGFIAWRAFSNQHPDMDIAALMRRAVPILSDNESAAYSAPFPDVRYKAGVRRFPNLVAENFDDPGAATAREARQWWQTQWHGQSLMAIGMADPVLGLPVMTELHRHIHACPKPLEFAQAGHFVQEWGAPIAQEALKAFSLSE